MKVATLQYQDKEIEVKELYSEDFGFILYEGINGEGFFLVVLKNHSAAYWSETITLSAEEKEELQKTPSYSKALELLNRNL